uniref:Uncharacterized protein n=1 Tax=Cacopsylla melanoneura TaxID=428564 RepID=A0A8D8Q2Z7_9HEMI
MASSAPPPLDLDPKEVLAHLNYLGYHHITGHQLKDFMKDLKKLIRYDQLRSKENITPVVQPMLHQKRKSCHRSLSAEKHNKLASENRSSSVCSMKTSSNSNTTDSQQKPLRPLQSKLSDHGRCVHQVSFTKQAHRPTR